MTQRIEAADAYRELGDRLAVDDPASAEVAYRRALDYEPSLPDVYVRLAATLIRLGRLCEAEGHLPCGAPARPAPPRGRRAALRRPAPARGRLVEALACSGRLRAWRLAAPADRVRRRARAASACSHRRSSRDRQAIAAGSAPRRAPTLGLRPPHPAATGHGALREFERPWCSTRLAPEAAVVPGERARRARPAGGGAGAVRGVGPGRARRARPPSGAWRALADSRGSPPRPGGGEEPRPRRWGPALRGARGGRTSRAPHAGGMSGGRVRRVVLVTISRVCGRRLLHRGRHPEAARP